MSGVLLSVAFYAILRVKLVADAVLGPGFVRALLVVMALASLVLAASLLIAQRDYKRMLAYSSIEHLGLIAVAPPSGARWRWPPCCCTCWATACQGRAVPRSRKVVPDQANQSHRPDPGLAARQPVLAGCLGFGVLALIGLPPFSVFASELGIARAGSPAAWAGSPRPHCCWPWSPVRR